MNYIIIDSWNDVLYRVVAWSRNYYLTTKYFEEYNKNHSMSKMVGIEADTIRELSLILKKEYDTSIPDLLDNEIKMFTSKDNKISALALIKHSNWFDLNSNHYDANSIFKDWLLDLIPNIILSIVPLIKYIDTGYPDDLLQTVFVAYQYRYIPNIDDKIDLVYFMYFILKIGSTNKVMRFIDECLPITIKSEVQFIFN